MQGLYDGFSSCSLEVALCKEKHLCAFEVIEGAVIYFMTSCHGHSDLSTNTATK